MTNSEQAKFDRAQNEAFVNLMLAVAFATIAMVAILFIVSQADYSKSCTETRTMYTVKGPMQTCIAWRLK